MKAIVLTFDRHRALTEHMVFQYDRLWPDHPFCFRIPYQNLPALDSPAREYRKTPVEIKATILNLLDDLDDEEWVYWCIDDKYPIDLDLARIRFITKWIGTIQRRDISGVLFCRCRYMRHAKYLTGESIVDDQGNVYLERKAYEQIWIHQFLRVKVIRHIFNSFPNDIASARTMDRLKTQVDKPASHRLFVTQDNLAVFGESTSRGMLTQNCYESIIRNNLTVPPWCSTTDKRRISIGRMSATRSGHCVPS